MEFLHKFVPNLCRKDSGHNMRALQQQTRRDHIIFVMGRGKQWTVPETKALVEAFIHISEDAVVGTDQSSERLYQRVSDEAKTRYQGDWMRTGDGCKKRWASKR